jgi:hypothetical protein
MLASHPAIGSLPDEGVFFTDFLPYPEQFGWTRMWTSCLDSVRLKPEDLSITQIERIKKDWSLWYPKGKPCLLEKSISNSTRMLFMQAHFKPAYFIYLVRNGYAVAAGIRRRAKPRRWLNSFYDEYPIDLCAKQWVDTDKIISRDSLKVEHFIQISYEELTRTPMKVLHEITDFLGLSSFEGDLRHVYWSIQERKEQIVNMNVENIACLSELDKKVIESVAGETLDKYGYSFPV